MTGGNLHRPLVPMKVDNVLDLPEEIQREICSHCNQGDLICLSLVNKRFRELAAAFLYRNFHIVFPDEDDPAYDTPIDGLAGGLDTFVTSEYDYAKHLRDISLDTLSAGTKAETAYKPYLYSVSCGKFMNTLLLLTLRKAKSLDTFKWNIRVELSRPVYKALHDIKSLKHLHLRLQAGESLYEPPPPLPYYHATPIDLSPASQWPDTPVSNPFSVAVPSAMTIPPGLVPPPGVLTYGPPPVPAPPPPPIYKTSLKSRLSKRQDTAKEPPTIGGFKNLQSLSILDIDNLGMVPEIQTCLRNSSSTLKKLKLSFSDVLAMQARKPCVDMNPSDSDDDDEFQVVPVNSNYDDGSGPARAFRAQEERKCQESVLGRIFDVEQLLLKRTLRPRDAKKKSLKGLKSEKPGQEFINSIAQVSRRLFAGINGTDDLTQSQQEILDTIVKASQKYVDAIEVQPNDEAEKGDSSQSFPNVSSSKAGDFLSSNDVAPKTMDTPSYEAGLFEKSTGKSKEEEDEMEPEDIDVAAPEDQLLEEPQEDVSSDAMFKSDTSPASTSIATPVETSSTERSTSKIISAAASTAAAQKELKNLHIDEENLEPSFPGTKRLGGKDVDAQHELNIIEAEIDDIDTNQGMEIFDDPEDTKRQITEYARSTRGIALDSLGVHLIPVKASVLGKAVNLHCLKKITLLNVGNQAPIWSLMAKENKIQPLALQKIFTDNVSLPFLHLLSQLNRVTELFMLERSSKYKLESFAPKTKVTLEQIRRFALKKHMSTIERLIIKNETDNSWDLDIKTTHLICKLGKELEEMAVIMGIRAIHAFLQSISGLVSLRALHIISFRSDDTCLSVVRETRKFIVDTISHYPELPLEWIAMGDDEQAHHILRKTDTDTTRKTKQKKKKKGKEVASYGTDTYPILPVHGWDDNSDSSDDDDGLPFPLLKLELIENVNFYDVWGVKIFTKEILAARL